MVAGLSAYGGSGARRLTRLRIGTLGTRCVANRLPSLPILGAAANSDPNVEAPTQPRPTDLLPPRPIPPAAKSRPGNQSQITSMRFCIWAAVRFERSPEGCALPWFSNVFKVHRNNQHITCPAGFIRRAALWQNTPPAETSFETEHGCEEVSGWAHARGSHNVTVTIAPVFGLSVKTVVGCPSLWAVWAVSAVRVLGPAGRSNQSLGSGSSSQKAITTKSAAKNACVTLCVRS